MSKGRIITLSIISAVLLTLIILFGFVFCLYSESVEKLGDVDFTQEEIVSASGLKHGKPIFSIDKEKSIARIEKALPTIKVEAIKTTSLRSIKFIVSTREAVYCIKNGEEYLILDAELKVINVTSDERSDLISIDNSGVVDVSLGDFIRDDTLISLRSFYDACYTYITNPDNPSEYLDRVEICNLINYLKVNNDKNFEIIIKLNNNFKISIANAKDQLDKKVNMAFSTYNAIYARENEVGRLTDLSRNYEIVVTYNADGEIVSGIYNK